MTKPLTKVRICPTCQVNYKSSETIVGGRAGRTCPNGHFHTYYQLSKAENGGNPPAVRQPKRTAFRDVIRTSAAQDRTQMLALLWVSSYERLVDQLPASTSRLLVEGAMSQAYQLSKRMLDAATRREAN